MSTVLLTVDEMHWMFAQWQHSNPHPTTELRYESPFELLIAVMLSAQATDKSVNLATELLFAKANTPQAILAMGEERLKQAIASIGLYKTKAKHVMLTCQQLLWLHDGQVPRKRADLEALPGVGRKTANVILNTLYGEPVIAVDTHVFRVANRTGLARGETPLAIENQLQKRIPQPYLVNAHHWLILHGRYTCLARKPRCGHCQVKSVCRYESKTDN